MQNQYKREVKMAKAEQERKRESEREILTFRKST
jgi:hypothetical protein